MDLISVIIPSFRQARFLRAAVDSARDQNYGNLEILIIDDCSGDRSLATAISVATLDPRVRLIRSAENRGLGAARNLGLAAARGEYVLFLDSDDCLLPGALSALHRSLDESSSSCVGSYGEWQHVPEHIDIPATIRKPRADKPFLDSTTYAGTNLFICSAPLTLRSALLSIGGFAEDLPMLEDFATWVKLINRGAGFAPAEAMVSTYRQRAGSMLRSGSTEMPAIADAINRFHLESDGDLHSSGRVQAFLAGERSRPSGRPFWGAASSFDHNGRSVVSRTEAIGLPLSDLASQQTLEALRRYFELGALDCDSILARARPAARTKRRRSPGSEREVIVMFDSVEGSAEAVSWASALAQKSTDVVLGTANPTGLDRCWPAVYGDQTITDVRGAIGRDSAIIAIGSDELCKRAVEATSVQQVLYRPTGIQNMRRDGQRRTEGALAETPRVFCTDWEMNIAADGLAPGRVVPSGIKRFMEGHLPHLPRPVEARIVVWVPDSALGYPALDGWISTVVSYLSTTQAVILGSPAVARRLSRYRIENDDLRTIASASGVVLPLCDEISICRSLGVRPLVFEPSLEPSIWPESFLKLMSPISDPASLGAQLASWPLSATGLPEAVDDVSWPELVVDVVDEMLFG